MSPAISQPQGLEAQGRRIVAQLLDQYHGIRLSDRRTDDREDFVAAVDILNLSDRSKLISALSIDMSPAGIRCAAMMPSNWPRSSGGASAIGCRPWNRVQDRRFRHRRDAAGLSA